MSDAKTLGLQFLQAFWAGKPNEGYALCAPDARWCFQQSLHDPQEVSVPEDVDWLMKTLVSGFAESSGYRVTLRDAIGEGDEAAIEYSATGLTRTGRTYLNYYVVRFTASRGQITSIRPYFDTHYVSRYLFDLG